MAPVWSCICTKACPLPFIAGYAFYHRRAYNSYSIPFIITAVTTLPKGAQRVYNSPSVTSKGTLRIWITFEGFVFTWVVLGLLVPLSSSFAPSSSEPLLFVVLSVEDSPLIWCVANKERMVRKMRMNAYMSERRWRNDVPEHSRIECRRNEERNDISNAVEETNKLIGNKYVVVGDWQSQIHKHNTQENLNLVKLVHALSCAVLVCFFNN